MSRLQNTDNRRGRLWNWFDRMLFLLFALVLIVAFFGFRYMKQRAQGESGTVTYTVLLSDLERNLILDEEQNTRISVGDPVRSQNGTVRLGQVFGIEIRPHRLPSVRDGEIVFEDAPDRVDCRITVTARASRKDGDGVRVGDIRVAAGGKMTLRIGGFFRDGAEVTNVKWEVEEDD